MVQETNRVIKKQISGVSEQRSCTLLLIALHNYDAKGRNHPHVTQSSAYRSLVMAHFLAFPSVSVSCQFCYFGVAEGVLGNSETHGDELVGSGAGEKPRNGIFSRFP